MRRRSSEASRRAYRAPSPTSHSTSKRPSGESTSTASITRTRSDERERSHTAPDGRQTLWGRRLIRQWRVEDTGQLLHDEDEERVAALPELRRHLVRGGQDLLDQAGGETEPRRAQGQHRLSLSLDAGPNRHMSKNGRWANENLRIRRQVGMLHFFSILTVYSFSVQQLRKHVSSNCLYRASILRVKIKIPRSLRSLAPF